MLFVEGDAGEGPSQTVLRYCRLHGHDGISPLARRSDSAREPMRRIGDASLPALDGVQVANDGARHQDDSTTSSSVTAL